MAFDNFNWQHNNRGASDPALKAPAALGGAPSQADINRQKRKENTTENQRRRAENERRRKATEQNRQTNVNPEPPKKDPAGGFIHPALWTNPIIGVPAALVTAAAPIAQDISSSIYSEQDGKPIFLGKPVFRDKPRTKAEWESDSKRLNEAALNVVPAGRVASFGTATVKGAPVILKTAGGLDSKFLGGALAATVAGIGYEANRRGLLDMPEISGNPQAPGEITTPKSPGLPSDLTPGTRPGHELVPHDLMSGRSLQIQPDVKGISQHPLITRADSAAIGRDSGKGFGPSPAFPKFDDDFFPSSPGTPVLPGNSNKTKSPAKSRDQIIPDSPAPFDFVQPQVPAEVAPQTAPAASSPGISISMPQPVSPSIPTPVPGSSVQPSSNPGTMFSSIITPGTTPATGSTTINLSNTPSSSSSNTPSVPDYAPAVPAVTVPDYPNQDLTQSSDAFDFSLPNLSRPSNQRKSRRRIDLPEFTIKAPKIQSSTKTSKDWYVKNPVPSVIFGKTPQIKTPKSQKIKLPRFKL